MVELKTPQDACLFCEDKAEHHLKIETGTLLRKKTHYLSVCKPCINAVWKGLANERDRLWAKHGAVVHTPSRS